MSGLQSIQPVAEAGAEISQRPDQPRLTVEQALHLPALLGVSDLADLWGRTLSQIHRLDRDGAFDLFKVHPAIGTRRFSGVLVGRYLSGEPLALPTFGRSKRRG